MDGLVLTRSIYDKKDSKMKSMIFSVTSKHFVIVVFLISMLCIPASVFAFGGSDKDTNIRNVESNAYINDEGIAYVPSTISVSWKEPELSLFDNYLYVVFLDDNGDGKLNGKSEVFYLSQSYTGQGCELEIDIDGKNGTEKILLSNVTVGDKTRDISLILEPDNDGKKIGIIIASYYPSPGQGQNYHTPHTLRTDYYRVQAIVDYYPPKVQPVTVAGGVVKNQDGCYYVNTNPFTLSWDSFKETGAGIKEYLIKEQGQTSKSTTNLSYDLTTSEGLHQYTIAAYDQWDRVSTTDPYDIICDTTAPVLKIYGNMAATEWTHSPSATIYATATDSNLDAIYGTTDSASNPTWTKGDRFDGSLPDGSYTCQFKARDKAGNETTSTGYYNIDRVPPVISGKPSLSFVKNSPIQKLKVNWSAGTDPTSGIKHYVVCYRTAPIDGNYPAEYRENTTTIANGSPLTDGISLVGLSRAKAQKIQVAVKAVDNSGLANALTPEITAEIILPATIEGTVSSTEIVPGSEPDTPVINVEVDLNVTLTRALSDYDSITYVRTSSPNRTPLPPDDKLPKTVTITNAEFGALQINPTTKCLTIVDRIPSSSGAGHKYIKYAFSSKSKSTSFSENNSVSAEYLLPNNPGTIAWKLFDKEGHELRIDENGTEVYRDPEFKIYTDGKALVSFLGEDFDQDPWTIELDRTKKIKATPYDLISYQRISGKNVTAYTTKTGMQPVVEYPVTLSYGTNTLLFIWDEGNITPDNNLETQKSTAVNIILDAPVYGVYSLRVTDEYASYDSSGIRVRPGENLKMELSAPVGTDNVYAWDFGDGNFATTKEVEHIYSQRPGNEQLTDTTVYKMELNVSESSAPSVVTTIPIDITVRDTQEGELFTSEVWRGAHTLTGVVVVPAGMNLTIGSEVMDSDLSVTSVGGPGVGYSQGIRVLSGGSLTVDNNGYTVTFSKTGDQKQGWGTLFIDTGANATINDAIIEFADRGVTANEGSSVRITDSVIRQNGIGVHVMGGSDVTIENSEIIANTIYGVKEEHDATPVLRLNSIFGNLRDYYEWSLGPITINEINSKPNCRDNRGE